MVVWSLSQTRSALTFKSTKSENPRPVSLPASAIAALNAHRKRQDEFRRRLRTRLPSRPRLNPR
jgi:hypothetical protein